MEFTIRKAIKSDMSEVLDLIKELAVFEKEGQEAILTIKDLENDGFGDHPLFYCFVVECNTIIVGAALCYIRYSTWKGKTLHLEDLIVNVSHRNLGFGTLLLDEVIKLGAQLKVKRVCWEVLDWNTNAINFYKKKGAKILTDWHLVQMDEALINNYLIAI